jgi:ATP-dependent DNA helicase RecQ
MVFMGVSPVSVWECAPMVAIAAIQVQFNRRTDRFALRMVGRAHNRRFARVRAFATGFKPNRPPALAGQAQAAIKKRVSPASPAHFVLHDVFGYEQFRGPQESIVEHVIAGGDALVLMPTGGGKSLCYQVPAIVRRDAGQGVTVVVSPLIALMHDQVGALHEAGVEAAFLNSTLDWQQTLDVERRMARGEITLLYAAPERVTTERFLGLLDGLHERGQLSLFAIDEAHCVSQWGHDFRPEYRQLSILHERYASVPRIALTATADALTRADIVEGLRLQDARQFVSSFDRPNIRYRIAEKKAASTRCPTTRACRRRCARRTRTASCARTASSWWPPSPSAWASTSPTCASSPTWTCPRTSRATTRRPAAPAATACPPTPGWPMACRTW